MLRNISKTQISSIISKSNPNLRSEIPCDHTLVPHTGVVGEVLVGRRREHHVDGWRTNQHWKILKETVLSNNRVSSGSNTCNNEGVNQMHKMARFIENIYD